MAGQRWSIERERAPSPVSPGLQRTRLVALEPLPRSDFDPVGRSLLALQSRAGNAAVTGALLASRPTVQREKPKKPPKWLKEAREEFKVLFPKEQLMKDVVIRDYGELKDVLQGVYGAWTQSATEIYVRDPMLFEGVTTQNRKSMIRYILQHEAVHVRQFATAKGPPKKWQTMVQYEIEAYGSDKTWLAGDGKRAIPDAKLRAVLLKGVEANHKAALDLLWAAADVADSEAFLYQQLKNAELIPQGAAKDPLDLYRP